MRRGDVVAGPPSPGGNGLSWFYTFEWPILAGIAIAAWWHLIHENPEEREARKRKRAEKDPAERAAEWCRRPGATPTGCHSQARNRVGR